MDRAAETEEGSGVTNAEAVEKVNDYYAGGTGGKVPDEIKGYYSPGSALPWQWVISKDVKIPVAGARIEVTGKTRFPREGGSTQKWRSHGRDDVMGAMAI